LRIPKRSGLLALLFLLLAVGLAGCMPRGTGVRAGWTVLSANDGQIYAVLATGEALALDADSGEIVWRYPLEPPAAPVGCGLPRRAEPEVGEAPLGAVYGQPAVLENEVLIGSFDGNLYSLDRETGRLNWMYPVSNGVVGGIAIFDGIAYFGAADHHVYALDLDTLQLVWDAPFPTGERIWGAPAVDQERIYIGSMDQSVYAIDRQTGQQIWSQGIGAAIPGDVVVMNGRVAVGAVDSRLHVLNADTGELLWQTERLDGWIWGQPVVIEDSVYFTSLNGTVYGYGLETREPLWSPITVLGSMRAGPTPYDGRAVVGTNEGRVYLIDLASGQAELLYGGPVGEQRGALLSAPIVIDNQIYVGSATGSVVALDPTLRNPELWVYPPADGN
jgi:outer membrane protein assembly factor BamB